MNDANNVFYAWPDRIMDANIVHRVNLTMESPASLDDLTVDRDDITVDRTDITVDETKL